MLQLTIEKNCGRLIQDPTSSTGSGESAEMNNQAKYPEIAEEILSRIKQHKYGAKLPPVRELAADFSVSTRTMQKALTRLVNSCWILPDGVNGTRINYQKSVRRKNGVICIFTNSADGSEDPLIRELLVLIRKAGCQAMLASMPDLSRMSRYEVVSRMPVDGFIFLFSSIRQKLCEVLTLADIPFVSANQLPESFPGSWCDFDFRDAYRQVFREFTGKGIFRIALHDIPHFSDQQDGIKAIWKEMMEEFHIPRRFRFPVLGRRETGSLEKDLDGHLDEWFSRRCVPQAIICRSKSAAFFAERIPERFGLRVPEDVMIFEIEKSGSVSQHPVRRIIFNTPYAELAHAVWELFQLKMNGHGDASRSVAATLAEIR